MLQFPGRSPRPADDPEGEVMRRILVEENEAESQCNSQRPQPTQAARNQQNPHEKMAAEVDPPKALVAALRRGADGGRMLAGEVWSGADALH